MNSTDQEDKLAADQRQTFLSKKRGNMIASTSVVCAVLFMGAISLLTGGNPFYILLGVSLSLLIFPAMLLNIALYFPKTVRIRQDSVEFCFTWKSRSKTVKWSDVKKVNVHLNKADILWTRPVYAIWMHLGDERRSRLQLSLGERAYEELEKSIQKHDIPLARVKRTRGKPDGWNQRT